MFTTADFVMTAGALVFIVLDVATGFTKAVATHTLSSTKMREGLIHKVAFLIAIAVAYVLQMLGAYGLAEYAGIDWTFPSVLGVCCMTVITELLSIVENIGEINPELKGSRLLGLFASVGSCNEKE